MFQNFESSVLFKAQSKKNETNIDYVYAFQVGLSFIDAVVLRGEKWVCGER